MGGGVIMARKMLFPNQTEALLAAEAQAMRAGQTPEQAAKGSRAYRKRLNCGGFAWESWWQTAPGCFRPVIDQNAPETVTIPLELARHCAAWLGRAHAEGAHKETVAPQHLKATLTVLEKRIALAES